MKFEDRHVLNKPAADVIKMYTDQKFFERKYKDLGAWDSQVLECKKDAKKFLIKCRYTIKSSHPSIPAFAQKLVGTTATVTQQDVWDIATMTGRLEVEIKGTPVKVSSDMKLVDEPKGAVNAMKWNVSCSIPLIGGKIEQLVYEDIKAKSSNDVSVTLNILKDY